MRDDSRTPDEIERDIEREREELASNVDALQNMFSPDAILGQMTQSFKDHGSDLGRAITQSAKQNPVALTLTGVGLAWLVFGRSYDPLAKTNQTEDEDADWPARGAASRPAIEQDTSAYPSWARDDLDDYDHDDPSWREQARDRVSGTAASVKAKVSSASTTAKEGVTDAAHQAQHRATVARDRLARGTEDMTDAARDRVIAAREKAVDMAKRADKTARKSYAKGRDATQDFIQEQPLVAGALAVALGAAIASALPRTKTEDRLIGEKRDDLFDEAERIFHQEREKAERVARATADEVGRIADEKRAEADDAAKGSDTAVEAAADEARKATKRVASKAKSEARKQNLGKTKKG
ncbi:MAG: DUF3618 domain-containing protein [Pseudomonadota bacterium]